MTETVEHECRQGGRCKARRRDGQGNVTPCGVERANTLCRACEGHAFDAMRELDGDWQRLHAALHEGPTSAGATGGSRSSERSIPIPLNIDALMTSIETETLRWARIVTRGSEDFPTAAGDCVTRCVAVLWANKGTLADLPARTIAEWQPHPRGGDTLVDIERDGVDAVLGLAKLHARASVVLGTAETRIWLPDPCPHCGRKALSPSKDQQRVSCQACRIVWPSEHFVLLGNVLDFERRTLKGETA